MSLSYRPEIDGLRAIAVLSVVTYHAGIGPAAGFVGVDVFFVISGYLITRLLRQELEASDRIDLVGFYARRARRILPALVALILATLWASAALLPPAEQQQTFEAAASALVFAGNVFFATTSNGYFEPETQTNPLLHLWSIGVEEQFYFGWPIVLLAARKRPAMVLACIAAASLITSEALLALGQERAAFYQTPARAWELATGGLIAVARQRAPAWAGRMGLLVVLAAIALPFERFPGTGAMLAVVGASMVVAAAHADRQDRILGSRPFVAVGVISYSLYLWHWPVVVLGATLPAWLQVAGALLLAVLSYRFIEQPFRHGWVKPARPTIAVAAALLIPLSGSALLMSRRLPAPVVLPQSSGAMAGLMPMYAMGCDDWYRSAAVKPCAFGPAGARHTAVIVGDSVSLQWFPAVRRIFDRPDWRLIALTKASCPMVEAPYHLAITGDKTTVCEDWRRDALHWIEAQRPEVVIVGSANNYGFSEAQWVGGTRAVLASLSEASNRTFLLRSTPLLRPGGQDTFEDVHRWQREAAQDLPNVTIVDMNEFVCPGGRCRHRVDGILHFKDSRHIAPELSASLSARLLDKMQLQF